MYISYAVADKPYLDTLLKWLTPLSQKYYLQIWHNPVPRPFARLPYKWDEMIEQLESAHIYLFLTSYHSLSTAYIEQEEVPRAVERYIENRDSYVRIFPVLLSPSHWKKHSGLAGFKPLGGSKTLSETQPPENGYLAIVDQLERVVVELRRNWMEEYHRIGLPAEDFIKPPLPPPAESELKPIPGWASAVLLFALLYIVTSVYISSCAPRMYHMYTPESMPYQPLPAPYFRENPVTAPADVPFRPREDTIGSSVRIRYE